MSVVLAGCGAATTQNTSQGTPTPTPTSSATVANQFSCETQSGGDSALAAQLTDVRTAHFDGYDELTFQYAAPVTGAALHGVPEFTVARHASQFIKDASGQPLTLDGVAALLVKVHNASGSDNLGPTLQQTYSGSLDMHPGLQAIREVAEVGDFERTLSWGVGLSSAACFRVQAITDPSRLVVDVQR
jgi:hypothetical protein